MALRVLPTKMIDSLLTSYIDSIKGLGLVIDRYTSIDWPTQPKYARMFS